MENRTVKGIQDVLNKMFVVDKRKRISVSSARGEIQLFSVVPPPPTLAAGEKRRRGGRRGAWGA